MDIAKVGEWVKNRFAKLIDVKSIVTIVMAIAFVILTFMCVISGDKFYDVFLMIISFYFGTQYQKKNAEGE